jgi:hypothetical protein
MPKTPSGGPKGVTGPAPGKPDLKALRERLRHKGDQRRGDGGRAHEVGHSGGGL